MAESLDAVWMYSPH